jgi:hypothetical protein
MLIYQREPFKFTGHFRKLNWRYLPYIRPIVQGYVREYPQEIWAYMVQYLHFRILKFPLINPSITIINHQHITIENIYVIITNSMYNLVIFVYI